MFCLLLVALLQEPPPDPTTTKEAMGRIQLLIGDWRCTGQPRDPKVEAWTAKLNWNYRIEKDDYRIELKATGHPLWKEALVAWDAKGKRYHFETTQADSSKRAYAGRHDRKRKELVLEELSERWPRERLVITLLRDNRFLIAHEAKAAEGKTWEEHLLVGCTKEGVPFARMGDAPLCLVTGGYGTIPVEHQGRTYYVC